MQEREKALLICIAFIFLLLFMQFVVSPFLFGDVFKEFQFGDFKFHYYKTRGECIEKLGRECDYAPLFHFLAFPFSYSREAFWLFGITILGLFIPLLIFEITKSKFAVFSYFTSTNIFWFMSFGYYPLALATLMCLLAWHLKKAWQKAIIVLLAILTHSHAFYAVLLFALFSSMHHFKKFKMAGLILGCRKLPLAEKKIIPPDMAVEHSGIGSGQGLSAGTAISFFIKGFPFPFAVFSVREMLQKKKYNLLFLFVALFFFASVSYRVLLFASLPLLFGLADYYENANTKTKTMLKVLSALFLIIQLCSWIAMRIEC